MRRKRFRGMCDDAWKHERNPVFRALFYIALRSTADLGRTRGIARIQPSSRAFRRDIFNASRVGRIAERMTAQRVRDAATPIRRHGVERHEKNPGFRRGFDHSEK
ncbi:hypothetical protein [Lysobacter hankyongensis]|uniref:hypothetical protein n=1 Tax=Lysobacter hankyongensis TaxID=1176535 RepID=UPI0031E4FA0E